MRPSGFVWEPAEHLGMPLEDFGGAILWIMDPEGNKVELWEPMLWNEKNKGG